MELAAARTAVLSPAQIRGRLSQRLDLFKGGRDADPRQQTLRATIEWSQDLLPEPEQHLFARLSVFVGGWIFAAAEEIVGADVDRLQSLVEKSLVRRTGDRFWMLETIGELARERLQTSGEADDFRRRCAEYFLALAERAEPALKGADQPAWLQRLKDEHEHLRASLDRFLEHGDGEPASRLAGALCSFGSIPVRTRLGAGRSGVVRPHGARSVKRATYDSPVWWALLEGVPDDDVRRVLSVARRRTFGRGEVVFHEDDPADSLHLVAEGRFASSCRTPLGEDVLLALHVRGDAFGELALVSPDACRTATVTALDKGETRCVHRVDFDELRAKHPSVDRMLVGLLAARLRLMNERLLESFYEPSEKRVLRRLLELADAQESDEIALTQEQLAALAGTSRATVNAVLSHERRAGTLEVRRGAVVLADREALRRRAGRRPR